MTIDETTLAGAGGYWPRLDEVQDPRVEPQQRLDSCGPACARLVFVLVGFSPAPSQDEFYDLTGRCVCSIESLARAMNELTSKIGHVGAPWVGQTLTLPNGDVVQLARLLGAFTPWIAMLMDVETSVGHFVVAQSVQHDQVIVLDPWRPGTCYTMLLDDFAEFWTTQVVWRDTRTAE